MLSLDHPVITSLESVNHAVFWKGHPEEKNLARFWKNNLRQRQKSNPDVDPMIVLRDSAVGYGAELATTQNGVLKPVNGIVDDPDKIPFAQRMRDYQHENIFFQGKTCNVNQPYWYISPAQMKSLEHSVRFNDYLIVTGYTELGELHYNYVTMLIVDFKEFMSKPSRYLLPKAKYSYPFNADSAIEDGICYRF